MAVASKPERSKLTPAQIKKIWGVTDGLAKQFKLKGDDLSRLNRFADKYLRYKLGVRGTGPHAHGFNPEQRKAITGAINEAFGIKTPERKVQQAPAEGSVKKSGKNSRKPTAQLAKEQTARAESGQPIPGTEIVRYGS